MSKSAQLGEVHEAKVTGGTIRYRERGEGRTLLFVHGFLANGDLWSTVVPLLANGFRCVVPDWPLGAHDVPMDEDAELVPEAMAARIIEFADALGLEDPVLVGNDSGGALCQLAIARDPERFGGLTLTPCDAMDVFPPAPFNLIPPVAKTPVLRTLVAWSMALPLFRWIGFRPLLKRGYDRAIVKSWGDAFAKNSGVRRDGAKFGAGMDPADTLRAAGELHRFTKPVLIAWPPGNTFFKWSLAEALAERFPDVRLAPVEDAWTFLALDQPQALAKLIAERFSPTAVPVIG